MQIIKIMEKNIPIKKFSYRLIIFSIIMSLLTVVFQWVLPAYASPALPYIVLFFFLITELTLYIVLRDNKGKEGKRFISGYILSRSIKFISCLLFLLIYIVLNKEDAFKFAFAFIIIYFFYSGFEVYILKKENQK